MPLIPPETDHLVIVGHGMAAQRLIEALHEYPCRPARITVIGEEPRAAYNRILLSPWLAGELAGTALTLRESPWYAERGITLVLGERVTAIDRAARRLVTDAGRTVGYHRLVLATGSRPAMPAVPGITLAGVQSFRDLQDAERLRQIAERGGHVVVLGGGLLGLEAAEGLRKRGRAQGPAALTVGVVQRASRLMNRQLDATAAGLLEAELACRGLAIHTGAQLAAIEGDPHGRVNGVRLADGRRLAADAVVVAAGITPNAALGRAAGLRVDRGIVVDDTLTSSDPAIYALGECCQFQGTTYGLVEPIWRQVEVLAARLATAPDARPDMPRYIETSCATRLKISGVALFAFGPSDAAPEHEVLAYHDSAQGDYRRLLLRDGQLEGAVLYGDTAMGPWLFRQAQTGRDLSACRRALLLGSADAVALLDACPSATNADNPDRPAKEAA